MPAANKNATIHATVNLVQIDVQVTDRDGKPLKGLKAEQFSVSEDSKLQKISTFDYYDVAAIETASSQDRAPLTIPIGSVAPPEKLQQQLRDRRLIVLFFDMTSLEPDQLIRSINAADKFVRTQMTPADLVGIVYFGNQLRVLADFTTDKDFLERAIAALRPGAESQLVGAGGRGVGLGRLFFFERRYRRGVYRGQHRVQYFQHGSQARGGRVRIGSRRKSCPAARR